MKRLIVCADGTWNSADSATADGKGLTNVGRLRDVVAPRSADGTRQLVRYHDGVGARGSWFNRVLSGATGLGLSRNVRNLYTWIVEEYRPGDELYFFGFSRGAFTVRSLAGLIRNCGILRLEHATRVDEAYAMYRDRSEPKSPNGREAVAFRSQFSHALETPIKCIGVWDTVGSLGVPTGGPIGALTRRRYGFHDVRLSRYVEHAFHALAIDERRKPFAPTIWGVRESDVSKPGRTQVVEQVWFPGVHSNVGGGYADTSLSNLAFLWMLNRASSCGLAVAPDLGKRYGGDCCGRMYDSMTWFYKILGVHLRPIRHPITDTETNEPLHTFEFVASVAFDRRRTHVPPRYAPAYDPENLRRFAPAQLDDAGIPGDGSTRELVR
ncbi:MAG TPA: DUF2235 domain-containing protein [Gemmatimonadaceae bacterium]|nr:DUF2235 domain-containing protein [Gemmatimonadaceae bacterium]